MGNFIPSPLDAEETTRLARYQQALHEREQLISELQAQNLALKGSLREALSLMRNLVGILQLAGQAVPKQVADFLGMTVPVQRTSGSLKPREMEKAYRRGSSRCN